MEHRNPPKSPFYDLRIPGQCRHCGGEILDKSGKKSKRALWHPTCLTGYKMIHWPTVTRRAVFKRDKGKCASCNHQCNRRGLDVWHMDHVKPLIESQGDLSFWLMGNLQTLCQRCHFSKTGQEATARALVRQQNK